MKVKDAIRYNKNIQYIKKKIQIRQISVLHDENIWTVNACCLKILINLPWQPILVALISDCQLISC